MRPLLLDILTPAAPKLSMTRPLLDQTFITALTQANKPQKKKQIQRIALATLLHLLLN
jgi:hypothetical protein